LKRRNDREKGRAERYVLIAPEFSEYDIALREPCVGKVRFLLHK